MVIAERNKKICIFPLVLGAFSFICDICFIILKLDFDVKFIISLVLGFLIFFLGMYMLLTPKQAIIKRDETLIIKYLFHSKFVALKDIKYVSTTERGEYYNRDSSLFSDIIFFTDTRRVIVTYNEDNFLRHASVFVKNASAVKTSIDSLI